MAEQRPAPPSDDALTVRTDRDGKAIPDSGGAAPKTLWVVSGREDARVVLWDPDPKSRHPGGEAFVAGKVPEEVAETSEVVGLLRLGELREATEAEVTKRRTQIGSGAAAPVKGPWD